MWGDLVKPLTEQGTEPCYLPRLQAILRTHKAGLILPGRPLKSCYHLAALHKMLGNSAPAPRHTARL